MKTKQIGRTVGVVLGLGILSLAPWIGREGLHERAFSRVLDSDAVTRQLAVEQKLDKQLRDTSVYVDLGTYKRDGTWSQDLKKPDNILGVCETITIPEGIRSARRPGGETVGSNLAAAYAAFRFRLNERTTGITEQYIVEDTPEHFAEMLKYAPDFIKGQSRNWTDYNCTIHKMKVWTVSIFRTRQSGARGQPEEGSLIHLKHDERVAPMMIYILRPSKPAVNPAGTP